MKRLAVVFLLPALMFVAYFLIRLNDYQPEVDMAGVSSFIRVLFLAFGCSVCYLMAILRLWQPFAGVETFRTRFWALACLLLLLLLVDDLFRVHENVGRLLSISDTVILLSYGVLLAALVLFYRSRLVLSFWIFLTVFGLLSVIAILADNTGTRLTIAGRALDYEQIAETFGLLFLGAAFGAQAIAELRQAATPESG